LITKI